MIMDKEIENAGTYIIEDITCVSYSFTQRKW